VGPRLLTVEQAASYFGRTKEAVEHMVARRVFQLACRPSLHFISFSAHPKALTR